jgi:two-component system nitrate/nitrite response regulator NarL
MQQPPRLPAPQTPPVAKSAAPTVGNLLGGLPLAQTAARGMTEPQKRSKMWPVSNGLRVMNVLLVTHAGLFADAFAGSLSKLASRVDVRRCDPDQLETHDPGMSPSLVVLDIDALSGEATQRVSAAQERFAPAAVVALGAALDDNFIAIVMKSGVKAYLPKSYSETQALGLLQVVLAGGATNNGSPAQRGNAGAHDVSITASRKDRNQTNPYGLTARELEVLSKTQEGLTNLQIGKRLGMQEGTVKIHLSNAYKKLGVENRVQAIRIVERLEAIQRMEMDNAGQHSVSVRDWLLPHMSDESHRKGDILFHKGEPGRTLYFIQKGRIALPEFDKFMEEGEIFGEIGIFAPAHARTCTARCDSDVRLFCLTAEQARRLYFENPQFAYHVMQLIAQRLLDDQHRVH